MSFFELLSNVKTMWDIFSIFRSLLRISELYPTLPGDVQSEILNSQKGAKSRQIGPVIISRIFCCKKKGGTPTCKNVPNWFPEALLIFI
jgi:hypothetical protein